MTAEIEQTSQTSPQQEISRALEAVESMREVVGLRIKSLLAEAMGSQLDILPEYDAFRCGYMPLGSERFTGGGQGIVLDFGQHKEGSRMIVLEKDGIFEIPHELKKTQFIYTLSWEKKSEIKPAEYLDFAGLALTAIEHWAKVQFPQKDPVVL